MRCSIRVFLAIVAPVSTAAGMAAGGAASAQGMSVKDVFEKFNLIGIFSADCSKAASKDNRYFVNRVVDAAHVQRDEMSGPTTRDHVTMIDKATVLGPNEISLGGKYDDKPTEGIWHMQAKRHISWDVTIAGKKVISKGHRANGSAVPWLTKCGATGQ